jgi:hypothetical protein
MHRLLLAEFPSLFFGQSSRLWPTGIMSRGGIASPKNSESEHSARSDLSARSKICLLGAIDANFFHPIDKGVQRDLIMPAAPANDHA